MSYLDGIAFGTDQVSGQDPDVITFSRSDIAESQPTAPMMRPEKQEKEPMTSGGVVFEKKDRLIQILLVVLIVLMACILNQLVNISETMRMTLLLGSLGKSSDHR